jgi:sugar lactone lactonase YvrE
VCKGARIMTRRLPILLALLAASTSACAEPDDVAQQEADAIACRNVELADRTAGLTPLLDGSALEVVADLEYPPGNVAVSAAGRIFFSFFPPGNHGPSKVAELVDGKPVPYPTANFQKKLTAVLGVRVDEQQRLWILDYGDALGIQQPRLYAIDTSTNELVLEYKVPRAAAPVGAMFNDLQVAPDGKTVFISDLSSVGRSPAIVVVDLDRDFPIARRRLKKHASVVDGGTDIRVDGKPVTLAGILCPRFGVDGLALDPSGEYLYWAAVNGGQLFRATTHDLRYEQSLLLDDALATKVEKVADITATDGMTTDAAGHVYLSDVEHYAVTRVDPDGRVRVLVRDERLRWPDGFSWGPDGKLYVTASALHEVLPGNADATRRYNIFRIDAQAACEEGESCVGRVGH